MTGGPTDRQTLVSDDQATSDDGPAITPDIPAWSQLPDTVQELARPSEASRTAGTR